MAHNKKEEIKYCYICSSKIKYNHIIYLPYKDYLCSDNCLVEYRKQKNIINE